MMHVLGILCYGAALFVCMMFCGFVLLFYFLHIRTRVSAEYVEIGRLDGIFSAWRYAHRSADGFEEVSRITLWGDAFIFQRREDCESIYCCNREMRVRLHHVVGTDRIDVCDLELPYRSREKSLGLPEIASDQRCAALVLSARKLYKEYKSKSRPIIFFASRK